MVAPHVNRDCGSVPRDRESAMTFSTPGMCSADCVGGRERVEVRDSSIKHSERARRAKLPCLPRASRRVFTAAVLSACTMRWDPGGLKGAEQKRAMRHAMNSSSLM